jgi:hypothetical protein
MTAIPCPECGEPAEIRRRFTLWSTHGPLEHVKVHCARGHALTPLVDDLAPRVRRIVVGASEPALAAPSGAPRRA